MEIIGSGFLARHLRPIALRHPGAVALAAGASWAMDTSEAAFARETALVESVADRCRATGRLLIFFSTSSAAVYGADRPGREDDQVVPRNLYGAHKLALESLLRDSGTDYLVLRLAHVVGAGQPPHQLLPTLTRLLCENAVRVHRGATRDLIDVGDMVAITDALLTRGVRGETVNVASGTAVPIEEIIDHLERRMGVTARREYLDGGHAAHLVSTEKLRSLVPEVKTMGFGPDYYRRVLDSFLSCPGG
ncbi:NAD-dependent epimerase/dehydratase family protein [Streptosporangium sp. NPDC001559]|uniref:NAD-dependent epimerase/dehydratase family protein n=1 Tax=Streptosporangium sp. NPDC001559 TaxID=3366187 RepID=UPI0036E16BD3